MGDVEQVKLALGRLGSSQGDVEAGVTAAQGETDGLQTQLSAVSTDLQSSDNDLITVLKAWEGVTDDIEQKISFPPPSESLFTTDADSPIACLYTVIGPVKRTVRTEAFQITPAGAHVVDSSTQTTNAGATALGASVHLGIWDDSGPLYCSFRVTDGPNDDIRAGIYSTVFLASGAISHAY